jgi:hypothetical protein
MDGIYTWKGTLVEVIEIVGEYLIIQEIQSKKIHITTTSELDQTIDNSKIESESNIYSLGAWKECQEAIEEQERQSQYEKKKLRRKQSSKPRPRPKLKPVK